MPKKRGTPSTKVSSAPRLEEKILHNLVELQRIHTNLAQKFDKLSDQLTELLNLFEMAARTFASQPHVQATEKDKEFLDKIDKLLEQNKLIAKGLTLMEGKMREKLYGQSGLPSSRGPPPPRNFPR